eukprot:jgi/Botrbrau1/11442/Bobra.0328s0002.1
MSAVEVAICHMHSDHLQSEAIGSMWAAEEGTTDTWTLQPATFIEMLKPSKGWQQCSLKFRVCTLLFSDVLQT